MFNSLLLLAASISLAPFVELDQAFDSIVFDQNVSIETRRNDAAIGGILELRGGQFSIQILSYLDKESVRRVEMIEISGGTFINFNDGIDRPGDCQWLLSRVIYRYGKPVENEPNRWGAQVRQWADHANNQMISLTMSDDLCSLQFKKP